MSRIPALRGPAIEVHDAQPERPVRTLAASRDLLALLAEIDAHLASLAASTPERQRLMRAGDAGSNAISAEVRDACERKHGIGGTSRQLFYAYSVSLTSDAAGRALDCGTCVVVDRYWASTIAYPRVLGDATDAIERVAAMLRTPTDRGPEEVLVRACDAIRRITIRGGLLP